MIDVVKKPKASIRTCLDEKCSRCGTVFRPRLLPADLPSRVSLSWVEKLETLFFEKPDMKHSLLPPITDYMCANTIQCAMHLWWKAYDLGLNEILERHLENDNLDELYEFVSEFIDVLYPSKKDMQTYDHANRRIYTICEHEHPYYYTDSD